MDADAKSLTAVRWSVALTLLVVCASLVTVISSGRTPASTSVVHPLGVIAIALAAYAWVVYPPAGSIVVSLVIFLCVLWAWGVLQATNLGMDLAAFAVLLGVAASQQRRQFQRFHRLRQVLDDVQEEGRMKERVVGAARQSHASLQKKHARYSQLQAIAEQLSNMTDRTAIANLAVERAFTLIGKSDVCLLFLVDRQRQELSLFASKKRDDLASVRAKHGDQFDRYVLRTQRPLLVNDVRRDFRFTVSLSAERPIASVIACPLLLAQRAEGVLHLDSAQAGAYSQDDLRFLDILLDLISTAMTNAALFEQTQHLAMTDGLTGLMLRRPFHEQLTRELTRASRGKDAVSVIMLDVDKFKDYNDAFGHTAGDLVLRSVAEVLRTITPAGGAHARYGGEEFAVLLPRTKRHEAADIAEAIRRTVEVQVHRSGRGVPVPVTVSLGVAAFPNDAEEETELIRIADQRLYQAKHAGRNLVISS
jgi:diguanylate cyclase (GGDEF)-like protein